MPTAKLFVRDLNDAADSRRLQLALRSLPGVFGVVASCSARCVEVDFEDDQVGIDQLVEKARAEGFHATIAG
jgi:hypothetical protein